MASGYSPVPQTEFGGLNLRDAPDSVGNGCIDCLNIDLDYSGTRVRQRNGYTNLTSVAASNPYHFLFRQSSSALLASDGFGGSAFQSINSSGTITSLSSQGVHAAVNFGTPSTTSTYYSIGADTIRKLVGTTVSAPTATVDGTGSRTMPYGNRLAVQDNDNRLVVGGPTSGPNGASSSSSHVWFSDAGNAESWQTTNYVQLTPGDGEAIVGAVSWRGNLFIFKETRLFVFYGNSTDAAGNPVFNYRVVQLPSRMVQIGFQEAAISAGDDGVYFVTRGGLYVTTGDVPTYLSDILSPLATTDGPGSFFTAIPSTLRWSYTTAMHYHKRRIFITVSTVGTGGTFVYDIDADNWFVWSVLPNVFATWPYDDLHFGGGTASNLVYKFSPSVSTDAGSNISSYYRSGFNDFGREEEKTLAETQLWGTGSVGFAWSRDFGSLDTPATVTLGSDPAIANGRSLMDKTGTLMSYQLSSVSGGAWAVHRVSPYLREEESPGSKRS